MQKIEIKVAGMRDCVIVVLNLISGINKNEKSS